MWFRSLLTPRKSRAVAPLRRPSRRRTAPGLRLEALEDRSVPSCTVTLAPSIDSPLVGERLTWTATAVDCGAVPVYQFSAAPQGGAFHVVRDFSRANTFTWTPMQEGAYDIEVTVKDGYQATETTSAVVTDEIATLLRVRRVRVQVSGTRPSNTRGELHGLYTPAQNGSSATIKLWMMTAKRQQVVAFKTFLRTLLHEICHHLDYTLLGLADSFHTDGFYQRESSLFYRIGGPVAAARAGGNGARVRPAAAQGDPRRHRPEPELHLRPRRIPRVGRGATVEDEADLTARTEQPRRHCLDWPR